MIYLDEAATAPVRREALEAAWPYLTAEFGNPSSVHTVGEAARAGLERARTDVARLLGARAGEILFTSGGTEADNAAVKGIALASARGRHVIVSAVEHPAVLEAAEFLARFGGEVTRLPVDANGLVAPETLEAAIRPDTAVISIQHANSEIGTIQPVEELGRIASRHGVPLHMDAVQSAGTLPLDVRALGVQALTISGHKLGAPKGVGALYLPLRVPFEPLIHGGAQQRGRRSGTEDPAGAVALAAALESSCRDSATQGEALAARRDRFIGAVLEQVPGARLTGARHRRLPGHASFVFPGLSGESVLLELEARGIVCSSGSACAAGSNEPSHVLLALGLQPDVARTAVRFTFGHRVPESDLMRAASELARIVPALRR